MAIDQKTTALAIPDRQRELQDLIGSYPPDRYILLVPSTEFGFSPMFRPVISEVRLSTLEGSKDIYSPGGGRAGEVAIHATGLNRIANALAITWEFTHVEETKRWKWRAEAAGWIMHPNGDRIRHTGRYALDVSDDDAVIVKRILAKIGKQSGRGAYTRDDATRDIDSYRQFGEQRAETGARSRVIQWAANLQKTYSLAELSKKTFAALHWRPDERHPEVAKALIKRMGQASDVVFGPRQEALPAGIQGTVRNVDAGEGDEADVVGAIDAPAPTEAEIPAEEPAKAPPFDIAAVRAALEDARAKMRATDGKASDQQVLDIGIALRDVLSLAERVEKVRWPAVRLAVLTALWGVTATKELTVRQAAATTGWLATDEGKTEARALFEELVARDVFPVQQTLAGGAA